MAEDFATSKSKVQRIKAEFDRRMDSGPNDSQHPEASRSYDLDNQVFEMFQRLRSKNYPLNQGCTDFSVWVPHFVIIHSMRATFGKNT